MDTPTACVHPRQKQSVFVILQRPDGKILFVDDRWGSTGLPGGKGELFDTNQFATARREFKEETGVSLPKLEYKFFEWGDRKHTIRVYYAKVSTVIANTLGGAVIDPQRAIISCKWMQQPRGLLHHIQHAMQIWAMVDRKRVRVKIRRSKPSSANCSA